MFHIDFFEAQQLIDDATLVFSSEKESLDENLGIGKGIFSLYRLQSGKHLVEAYLVNQDYKEYNLLTQPSEVIQAFISFDRAGQMFEYLGELYNSDYEDVTISLPRKLLRHISYIARVRQESFASAFISSLDESSLDLK